MIEETAIVQSVNDGFINVVTTKSSSCRQCNEAASCSTSILSKFFGNREMTLQLQSNMSLKAGDEVIIGIEENKFVGLAILVYFLPLCALLLFSLFGQFIENYFSIQNELPTILLGILGFVGCYCGIKISILRKFKAENISPVVLKKL